MADKCQSCRRAPIEITECLNDPDDPFQVCTGCYRRLMTHSLRPGEWYNLSSVHGCFNELLSDACYDGKDGTALDPAEEVVDADLFPCPTLHEVSSSPERLLTYILTINHLRVQGAVYTWNIPDELVSAMQRRPPDILLSVFAERLKDHQES